MYPVKSLKYIFLIIIVAGVVFTSARTAAPAYRLIIFEGSDWCAKCIRLEEEVLSDTAFISFVKSYGIQLERIDFPQRKQFNKDVQKYNEAVAEKYKFDGNFPTLILADSNSETAHKLNYSSQNPEELISLIRSKISLAQ